jgi:hypothetical protein
VKDPAGVSGKPFISMPPSTGQIGLIHTSVAWYSKAGVGLIRAVPYRPIRDYLPRWRVDPTTMLAEVGLWLAPHCGSSYTLGAPGNWKPSSNILRRQ